MALLRITGLPDAPLDAAAVFHGDWLPQVRLLLVPPRNGEAASQSDDGGVGASPEMQASKESSRPLHHPADGHPPRSGEDVTLVFAPADHSHRAWRLAAVQELARASAPRRVNAVVCESEQGLSAALALLEPCQGITGQLLALDPSEVI